MNIKLIRLVRKDYAEISSYNDRFIEDINEQLMEEDIYLTDEDVDDNFIDVIFVESDQVIDQLKLIEDKLNRFVYIFVNNSYNSFAEGIKINNYLGKTSHYVLFDDNPLLHTSKLLPRLVEIAHSRKKLYNCNFALISEDPLLEKEKETFNKIAGKYGVNYLNIGISELKEAFNKHKIGKPRHLLKLKKMVKDPRVLDENLYLYGAISSLINKYNLKGISISRKDILNNFQLNPDLAFSLLLEDDIIVSDDVNLSSLISGYVAFLISGRSPLFVRPLSADYEKNTIYFKSSYVNLNNVKSFDISNPHDHILEVTSSFRENDACLLRLTPDGKNTVSLSGEIKKGADSEIELSIEDINLYSFVREALDESMIIIDQDISLFFGTFFESYNEENNKNN